MRTIIKLTQHRKVQSLITKIIDMCAFAFLSSLGVQIIITRLGLGLEREKRMKRWKLYLSFGLKNVKILKKNEIWFLFLLKGP
jgi:hypothetical protein